MGSSWVPATSLRRRGGKARSKLCAAGARAAVGQWAVVTMVPVHDAGTGVPVLTRPWRLPVPVPAQCSTEPESGERVCRIARAVGLGVSVCKNHLGLHSALLQRAARWLSQVLPVPSVCPLLQECKRPVTLFCHHLFFLICP